jgi:hypothetical protein
MMRLLRPSHIGIFLRSFRRVRAAAASSKLL